MKIVTFGTDLRVNRHLAVLGECTTEIRVPKYGWSLLPKFGYNVPNFGKNWMHLNYDTSRYKNPYFLTI